MTDTVFNIGITKASRDFYYLSFIYNKEIIENIKKLKKREYEADKKFWKVDAVNLYNLICSYKGRKDIFFDFHEPKDKEQFIDKYNKALIKLQQEEKELENLLENKKEFILTKETLFSKEIDEILDYKKYLKEGVLPHKHQVIGAVLCKKANRLLVAAGLGTGKTLLAILTTELYEESVKKVLVIVPNSLKFNWAMEIEKFTNQKAYILNEKKKANNKYSIDECKYFIVNYEYFRDKKFNFEEKITKFGIGNPDLMIFDESHKLKNTASNTTINIKSFFKKLDNIPMFMLSGTPMPNKLQELYVQLNFISPKEFPSKNKFYSEFCGLKYDFNYGWIPSSNKPLDLDPIIEKLDSLMFRVKTKDVLTDLPEIQINKIYLELSNTEEKTYKEIEDGLRNINWSNSSFIPNKKEEIKEQGFLELITKLRQFNSIVKLETIKNFVSELNEDNEKVVIFDSYINPLKQLTDFFPNNSKIYYGGVEPVIRQEYVNEFQDINSNLKNLFISTGSGNFGITLTAACNMLVMNLPFTPSEFEQMVARLHRMGQTRPVSVFIFIIKDTIDEYMDDLLKDKMKIISKVIDKEEYVDTSSPSLIGELHKLYKNKMLK